MHFFRIASAAALFIAATNANAGCGSAFCSLNTNWSTQGAWTESGGRFDLRYEFIDQDQWVARDQVFGDTAKQPRRPGQNYGANSQMRPNKPSGDSRVCTKENCRGKRRCNQCLMLAAVKFQDSIIDTHFSVACWNRALRIVSTQQRRP